MMSAVSRRVISLKRVLCHVHHISSGVQKQTKCFKHVCQMSSSSHASLLHHLRSRIKLNGPITVAEYMKEVLTNPVWGYYMNRDVFGSKGDFITSPEISQMFGELVGVWCLNEWIQHGHEQNIQIVELGPGRGTLADDILRALSKFKEVQSKVSLHMVEVSPALRAMQEAKLTDQPVASPQKYSDDSEVPLRKCISKYGVPVYWYKTLAEVPSEQSCYIAHEFLDALPIHKFQRKDHNWCEVMVDEASDDGLRFVLSKTPTVAQKTIFQVDRSDSREHIEVCPQAGVFIQELTKRIKQDGGCALIADYGHNGEKTDTFRGFKNHKLHPVLHDPGTADLTADVDFSYLKRMSGHEVDIHGPINQQAFLENMGIGVRLQVLLKNASRENRKELISGFNMLTRPDQMGERFKFLALVKSDDKQYVPAGFCTPQ